MVGHLPGTHKALGLIPNTLGKERWPQTQDGAGRPVLKGAWPQAGFPACLSSHLCPHLLWAVLGSPWVSYPQGISEGLVTVACVPSRAPEGEAGAVCSAAADRASGPTAGAERAHHSTAAGGQRGAG